jgi:hypothetical protein
MQHNTILFADATRCPDYAPHDVKGYAWSNHELGPLVANLDSAIIKHRDPMQILTRYRDMGGGWYLFREIGSAPTNGGD